MVKNKMNVLEYVGKCIVPMPVAEHWPGNSARCTRIMYIHQTFGRTLWLRFLFFRLLCYETYRKTVRAPIQERVREAVNIMTNMIRTEMNNGFRIALSLHKLHSLAYVHFVLTALPILHWTMTAYSATKERATDRRRESEKRKNFYCFRWLAAAATANETLNE